jgi:hypothetical protein
MNTMALALSKAKINPTDFEDKQIDKKQLKINAEIEFMEKWLKLLERNASEKEKHNFIIKHGFVSVMHFSLYLMCINDVNNLKDELDEIRYDISKDEIKKREEEIQDKEVMAKNIKNISYYKFILRELGKRDITPYGEDILKGKLIY